MEIPHTMTAMVLEEPKKPLEKRQVPVPSAGPGQVLIRVQACGVCRTDLHIVDGELTEAHLPLILGHEIVGTVVNPGSEVTRFSVGQRVGVPWLGFTCGTCRHCRRARENLCDSALFTGYSINGGYAEYAVADGRYCFHIPDNYDAGPCCASLVRGAYRIPVVPDDP